MRDRSTPETDAFAIKLKTICGEKYWVPVDLSRKLECEREVARELLKVQSEIIAEMRRPADQQISELEMSLAIKSQLCKKLERERDEAINALLKIEEIFIDGYDTYEDWKGMGEIARTFLENKHES